MGLLRHIILPAPRPTQVHRPARAAGARQVRTVQGWNNPVVVFMSAPH